MSGDNKIKIVIKKSKILNGIFRFASFCRLSSRQRRVFVKSFIEKCGVLSTCGCRKGHLSQCLLDGDRLGEISWTIDVAASQDGDVIRQQLHWNDSQNTLEEENLLFRLHVLMQKKASSN